MQITFRSRSNEQSINLEELNDFQEFIGFPLPGDYRQHMLTYNGGVVEQMDIAHKSLLDSASGISDFYAIKYGNNTIETINALLKITLPANYLIIGRTLGGGKIIISLNDDSTYGQTKEWYPDGTINDLSPSFTQLLNDQVEIEDYQLIYEDKNISKLVLNQKRVRVSFDDFNILRVDIGGQDELSKRTSLHGFYY